VTLKASTLHDFNFPRRKLSTKKQQQQYIRDVVGVGYPPQATAAAFDASYDNAKELMTHFVSVVPSQAQHQQHIPHVWDTTPFIIPTAAVLPPNTRQVVADVAEMTVGLLLVLVATHWMLTFMEPIMGADLTCAARWAAINGFLFTLTIRLPHHIHSHHDRDEEQEIINKSID
jgi:hypothetical protein